MGRRGPKSGGSKPTNSAPYWGPTAAPAPDDISPAARKIWEEIVLDCAPGHIQPKHYELFRGYCEESAIRNWAYAMLWEEGPVVVNQATGTIKKNPLIDIISAANTKIGVLCTKLGLNTDPKKLQGNRPRPPAQTDEMKCRTAYARLKERRDTLEGDEKSLFKKLEKEYGTK